MRVTLIQPQASGGEITNRRCPPQPDVLLFRVDGVVVAAYTELSGPGRRAVHLSFEVPADRTARLLDSNLEAITARGEHVRSPMGGTWYGSKDRSSQVHPDSLMRGRTERLRYGTDTGYGLSRHDFFRFTAEYATALGDTFTVVLPKLRVNEHQWELPPVRFVRVRRWVLMPFNC
jgi:hypothetical protein